MDDETNSDIAKVILTRTGLKPDEDELPGLADSCRALKDAVRSLYAVREARYASPALIFPPDPNSRAWDWEE